MTEPVEETVEQVLCVQYNGTANGRIVSARDLSGEPGGDTADVIVWTPGSRIEWEYWEALAGSRERAIEVLRQHLHEFSLVGPGAEELFAGNEEEEFAIGGTVEE